uniref:Uncharacterized protein n=1 Tax=Magallana gigas TaxID=29159 RepID=A0A8W8IJE3_MAGGI
MKGDSPKGRCCRMMKRVRNEATPVKRRKTIDGMERRLLMLEKLEKEDVSKAKERIKALAAQQDPSEPLILITLDE